MISTSGREKVMHPRRLVFISKDSSYLCQILAIHLLTTIGYHKLSRLTFEETRSAHTVSLALRCRISTDIYAWWQASETSLYLLASQPDIDHFIRLFREHLRDQQFDLHRRAGIRIDRMSK